VTLTSRNEPSQELEALLIGHWLTDMANFSAFVFQNLPDLNWAGFYLVMGSQLQLGPFVGKPACTEIRFDRGVCGAAYTQRKSLIVPNVQEYPGHIACDAASKSELVVPLMNAAGECIGVFDLDSPRLDRFKESDRLQIESWVRILLAKIPSRQLTAATWNFN